MALMSEVSRSQSAACATKVGTKGFIGGLLRVSEPDTAREIWLVVHKRKEDSQGQNV